MKVEIILKKINMHKFLAYIYFSLYKFGFVKLPKINYNKELDKSFSLIKFKERKNLDIPKNVWMYWHGDDSNVAFFSNKIRKDNPTWTITIVNKDNLKLYIPDFDINSLDMPLANITDLIRLELLYRYGGVWLDYTVVLTKNIQYFLNIPDLNKYDIVGYYRKVSTVNETFPAMESWFLAAPKKSRFIEECLNEFNLVKEIGSAKFYKKIVERDDFDEIRQNISPPDYLIIYLVFQIVIRYKPVNCYLYLSDNSAFLVQDTLGWRSHKSTVYLFMDDKVKELSPIYKLTSGDRQYFEIINKSRMINKNSILGNIIFDIEKNK